MTNLVAPTTTMNMIYPAGRAVDDVLLAIVVDDTGAGQNFAWDGSWTLVRNFFGKLGTPPWVGLAWSRYASGSNVNVFVDTPVPMWGAIIGYRGCTTQGSPIDGPFMFNINWYSEIGANWYDGSAPTVPAPDVNTTVPSCRVVNIFLDWGVSGGAPSVVAALPAYGQDFFDTVGDYIFDARGHNPLTAGTYPGGSITIGSRPTVALSFGLLPPGAPAHVSG